MSLNKKITELTELVNVDDSDLLVVVDDVSGTPTTKKITRANLVANIQPVLKTLEALGQVAGNLTLIDANWAISKAHLKNLRIIITSGSSTDYDFAIFEKNTFAEAYKITGDALKGLSGDAKFDLDRLWKNADGLNEVYVQIVDNDGSGAPEFYIELRALGLN
jgi:hypothetical protein